MGNSIKGEDAECRDARVLKPAVSPPALSPDPPDPSNDKAQPEPAANKEKSRKSSENMMDYPKVPSTQAQLEPPEEQRRRFEIECEFVQSLGNPHYMTFLAQRGHFKEEYFVNYLKYLLYFKRPEYARTLKYPQCLHMLELLQEEEFRKAIESAQTAKFIEDQQVLQWQFYLRKRQRLHENVPEEENDEEMPAAAAPAEEQPAQTQ